MDLRENIEDFEEIIRAAVGGLLKNVMTAMPAMITEDTANGHVATAMPTIKRAFTDPNTGQTTFEDHPVHVDVPIHHLGGGGVSSTFPNKKGDTGAILYMARAIDSWFQSDGTQQPMEDRMHSLADGAFLSGIRSIPRMLQQVEKDSAQHRSDDKHHVADLHPQNGITHKSVDPSTPVASASFDPFTMASKFFNGIIHPTNGIAHNATDGGTTHAVTVTHTAGAAMSANNSEHTVLAHPSLGSLLSAANGAHTVHADPNAGVNIQSAIAVALSSAQSISLSAPNLSLPAGGVSGGALASGAAASNVGALGGDLSGMLPNPQVVNVTKITNAAALKNAPDDATAAALGVPVDGLYRNGSALYVRVA